MHNMLGVIFIPPRERERERENKQTSSSWNENSSGRDCWPRVQFASRLLLSRLSVSSSIAIEILSSLCLSFRAAKQPESSVEAQ